MINAYYNGEFFNKKDVRIPLSDRAVFFGDAVYDAAIGRNGGVFMLDEHLRRFYDNCDSMDIKPYVTFVDLKSLILSIIKKTDYEENDYFVYFQASRNSVQRTHSYSDEAGSNLLITVTPISIPPAKKRLKLISYPDIRYELCDIKTVNLIPAVLASKYADCKGADEAVFIKDGNVTECAHSNIHILKDGILYTHPENGAILPGISKKHLLCVCNRLKITYVEKAFTAIEMQSAEQVLVTSSSKLCLLAESFDGTYYDNANNSLGDTLASTMREDYFKAMRKQSLN